MIHRSTKTDTESLNRPSWREYQAGLKRSAAKKKITLGILKAAGIFIFFLMVVYGIINGLQGISFSFYLL